MEFVTYEIAKKLKEKGFKEGCIKYFNANKALVWCTSPWLLMDFNNYISDPSRISAPTIFQTLKWLRKEKKIHITVPYEKEGFYFCIKQIDCDLIYNLIETNKIDQTKSINYFDSYEKAAIAGIEYTLKNFI